MFISPEVNFAYNEVKPFIANCLASVEDLKFDEFNKVIRQMKDSIEVAKDNLTNSTEEILNEFYIFDRFIVLLIAYSEIWKKIIAKKYSSSWDSVQDTLDSLRQIKKYSTAQQIQLLSFFENQLLTLEKLYPYNIFFSVGMVVGWFKCSICDKDIDSFECMHRRGELYSGKRAYGIAQDITSFDHASMVLNPVDKRCVIQFDDNAEQFKVVRFLSELLTSKKIKVFQFGEIDISKRMIKNPDYLKLGRNEKCFCGSGKKFKKCCINKESVEKEHIEILPKQVNINELMNG